MGEHEEVRQQEDLAVIVNRLFSLRVRAYIYRVLVAFGLVAVFYGRISQNEVVLWAGFVSEVLSLGGNALAALNTPTKSVVPVPELPVGGE